MPHLVVMPEASRDYRLCLTGKTLDSWTSGRAIFAPINKRLLSHFSVGFWACAPRQSFRWPYLLPQRANDFEKQVWPFFLGLVSGERHRVPWPAVIVIGVLEYRVVLLAALQTVDGQLVYSFGVNKQVIVVAAEKLGVIGRGHLAMPSDVEQKIPQNSPAQTPHPSTP